MIDITGLDKAEILAALYNNSKAQGFGLLRATDEIMTVDQARVLLTQSMYFDYLYGRVMKVDLSGDTLDPYLYDRDLGHGAAFRAINALRK